MIKKLAIFSDADPKAPFTVIYSEEGSKYTTLIRVTNWVEVEFTDRADTAEMVQQEVDRIDREMESTVEENVKKLKALKARKVAVLSKIFQAEAV
jgi:hypothetical protein